MKTPTRIIAIVWMAVASATWADNPPASLTMVPPQINYQGRLVTISNTPYADALHTIDLALYPPASNTKIWNERYYVQSRDGYFSVNLGSGTSLFSTNADLWRVLWRTNAAAADTFFLGLTVRTGPDGKTNSSPVEATPRQQFLSAPFAMRSFQSVYASKADGIFDAAKGVSTSSISSPTNNEVAVEASVRLGSSYKIYANSIDAHGTTPSLKLLCNQGRVHLGGWVLGGSVPSYASYIDIGVEPVPAAGCLGTDIRMAGKSIDIVTPSLTVNAEPMFVWNDASMYVSSGNISASIPHGIDTSKYEVYIVGYYCADVMPPIQYLLVYAGNSNANLRLRSATTASSYIVVHFLGVRKQLVKRL